MIRIASLDRLLETLRETIFTPTATSVPLRFRAAANADRAAAIASDRSDWVPVDRDLVWGEPDGYYWFGGRVTIPQELAGKALFARIEAQFGSVMGRSDPQLLVRIDGKITNGGDGNHREFPLTASAVPGQSFDILIEAGTIENRRQLGFAIVLSVHDRLAEETYYDLKVPLDVARLLKPDDARRTRLLAHIDAALKLIDLRPGNPERFADRLTAARVRADALYADADADAMPTIVATGHTHIDVAWLWRVRETRQKMARSIATALNLMEQYPDYRFMYNQGLLLDYLEHDYPELFERIKASKAAGQFEIEGALWLEPDVNISSGESLVRHILHGVRYHQQKFGVTPRIVWLPDTFGYSAALPQLMALAGLDMFVTHKLSWNDTNRMPYEVFHWQGIDGTKVPAYFLTTQKYEYDGINTTYCPDLVPSHVLGTYKRFSQKGTLDELFLVYGHGDGGGGPTRGMLENVRRMERGIPGCPKVVHDKMGPFFARLSERFLKEPERFPTWVGELYLEYHRGTLTSVAKNKRANRLAETALRELETLAVLAANTGAPYPAAELWDLWQIVLLNQFHDILPGSSIGAVYDDSDRDYQRFFETAAALAERLAAPLAAAGQHLVLNVLVRPRSGLVALPAGFAAVSDDTATIAGQVVVRADGTTDIVAPIDAIPALGGRAVSLLTEAPALPAASQFSISPTHLENARLRVTLDAKGRITSILDKTTGRDAIPLGQLANAFTAHRDVPIDFDAWDIDASIDDQVWPIDHLTIAEVVESGPYRAAIRLSWRYEHSTITQILALEADAACLDIDGFVDWHEHQTLLKTAFPLAVRSDRTTAEIQFGHVARPTHRNTSWDQARFETSMQRWVDFSEPGFGVALLNDSKYGYDALGNVVRLTLIKSPIFPWPEADQGEHRFRYAVLLHDGDPVAVHEAAEDFNLPLCLIAGGSATAPTSPSLFEITGNGVTVEAIKHAEDGTGIIVRLWEATGQRRSATLTFSTPWQIAEADLLEQPKSRLAERTTQLDLTFTPFEIKTLKLLA
ncbi:alpha-mannosidase [Devosia sp.]|uniref:alpha-mannosidase n=1 Tax=Devosia sp. TaxID=1871048 RepID=UPI003BAC15C3